jgi:hypothetical protein
MLREAQVTPKVVSPKPYSQKPALKRLEGGQKQLQRQPAKKKQVVSNEQLMARLMTRLGVCPLLPPDYDATPVKRCIRRWTSRNNRAIVDEIFRLTEGHRQFLVVTVANTTAVCYADVWRIKSISIWCNNDVEDPTTVTLRPVTSDIDSNCFNDREASFSCSSRSEALPGHMKILPALDTPLGCWHKTSAVNATGSLFVINIDNGGASSGSWSTTTMDIEFEYVENLIGAPQGYSVTISATASVGTLGGSDMFFPGGGTSCMVLQNINRLI